MRTCWQRYGMRWINAPIDMILGRHDIAQSDVRVVTDPVSPSTRRHDREVKMARYGARDPALLDRGSRRAVDRLLPPALTGI